MSMPEETFFTTVGCMDGRVQGPVAEFGRQKFDAQFADTITEPGLVGILANNPSSDFITQLKNKILISLEKHHSRGIIIHGHQNCAASNAVDDEIHKNDIRKSVKVIQILLNSALVTVGVFVKHSSAGWIIEEL